MLLLLYQFKHLFVILVVEKLHQGLAMSLAGLWFSNLGT